MSRLFTITLGFIASLLLFLPAAELAAKGRSAQAYADSRQKKADYLFMEAASAYNRGDYEQSYLLLRHANAIAPSDLYIAGTLAEMDLILPTADSATVERSYKAVIQRFYADPADEHNTNVAANLATKLRDYDELIEIWQTVDSVSPKRSDAALNLADALLERYAQTSDSTDFKRAFAVLDRLETVAGPVSPIAMRKISALSMNKDTVTALAETRKYVAAAPGDPSALVNAAIFYEHLGLPDSARVFYDRAVAIDPEDGSIHVARANFFNRQNDSIAFDKEVVRALESPMLVFEQKMPLLAGYVTSLYSDSLNWERIYRMFGIMQEVNAGEPELHDYYAYFKQHKKDLRGAVEQLTYAVDLDPSNIDRRLQLISTLFEISDTTQALQVAKQTHIDFPTNVPITLYLASNEAFNGNDTEALALVESLPVDSIDDVILLARIYATKGDILSRSDMQASTTAYLKSISYDSSNPMTLNNVAYHWAVSDTLLEKAALYAELALEADSDNPTYIDTYAWVYFKLKEYAKAKDLIDRALSFTTYNVEAKEEKDGAPVYPISYEILDHAGDIYFMNGEFEKAVEFWKKALELDPGNKKIEKKIKQRAYSPD